MGKVVISNNPGWQCFIDAPGFSGFIADFGYLVRLKETCKQKCIVLVFWVGRVKKNFKS